MQVAVSLRPLHAGPYCGDVVGYWSDGVTTTLAIIDGLGHGKFAEIAGKAALSFIENHLDQDVSEIFSGCSDAIRDTRGVAMGIARINEIGGALTYSGVGNTRAMIIGKKTSRLSGNNGIVGVDYQKLSVENGRLDAGDLVFLYTDGLREFIDISLYRELLEGDLDLLASSVIEDLAIERDDAALLIYRKEAH